MVILFAILLSIMGIVSYYWQHYSSLPLLNFALGVMGFAYASLLGVIILLDYLQIEVQRGEFYML